MKLLLLLLPVLQVAAPSSSSSEAFVYLRHRRGAHGVMGQA
jgi:hypothetical protein